MSFLRLACFWTRAVSTRKLGSPLRVEQLSPGNIFSFALLSLPYSILHVPRVGTKTSFPPEPTQPTSTHWLSDLFSLSSRSPSQSLLKSAQDDPSMKTPIWPLNANPHFPVPATLNQVPCFNSTSYNVKLITCWGCSLLGYSPRHQASPVLSRAANTCPRRCSLNAHEWIKVY